MFLLSPPLLAQGEIRKLKGIDDSFNYMQQEYDREDKSYKKAKEFISSPDIKKGLSSDTIVQDLGKPVAEADNGLRWVYKPSSSTFFEGEKIYLFFNGNGELINWEQIQQKASQNNSGISN